MSEIDAYVSMYAEMKQMEANVKSYKSEVAKQEELAIEEMEAEGIDFLQVDDNTSISIELTEPKKKIKVKTSRKRSK